MATYSSGIKINAAVNASAAAVNVAYSAAIYTAPADGYAIVRVSFHTTAGTINTSGAGLGTSGNIRAVSNSATWTAGAPVGLGTEGYYAGGATSNTISANGTSGYAISGNIYVGPGQSVYGYMNGSGGPAGTFYAVGVEFKNT